MVQTVHGPLQLRTLASKHQVGLGPSYLNHYHHFSTLKNAKEKPTHGFCDLSGNHSKMNSRAFRTRRDICHVPLTLLNRSTYES